MKRSRLIPVVLLVLAWTPLICYLAHCQGLAQQSTPTFHPEVWDKTNPAYNAPGAAAERAAETAAGATKTATDLKPTGDAFPFGALISTSVIGFLSILTNILQARAGSQTGTLLTKQTGGTQAIVDSNPSLIIDPNHPFAAEGARVIAIAKGTIVDPLLNKKTPSVA